MHMQTRCKTHAQALLMKQVELVDSAGLCALMFTKPFDAEMYETLELLCEECTLHDDESGHAD